MGVQYIATIDATHAGFINNNNTWYIEDHMKAAVESWITPYNKPVLRHHDSKSDSIGYVIDAQYVVTDNNITGRPKGHIRLRAVISDPDAVQKIKDGRYNTVSISADAQYARCSICDHKISEDGLCEHKRGEKYKGKKCFWYIGALSYKEVSYVNAPADQFASTIKLEEKETNGLSVKGTIDTSKKSPQFVFEDSEPSVEVDEHTEWTDFTEDDLAMAHWLFVEIDAETAEDAKIPAKARKGLSSSTFCGPERSFPVPDCAHVTSARRLIGRYKGPGNKSKILACVSRKAKSLGCGGEPTKKDEKGENEMTLAEIVARDDVREYMTAEVAKSTKDANAKLSALDALDDKVRKQDEDIKTKDAEVDTLKKNVTALQKDNEDLRTSVHQNLVDKVYDLRVALQKPDVQALKDEKEVTGFKTELAGRTDESLKDAINDLSKEELPAPSKKIGDSKGDGEISDDKKDKKTSSGVASQDPSTRKQEVKNFIFDSDVKSEAKE